MTRLDETARQRVLDFVRPMAVGLDGMTNFGSLERRRAVVARLAAETTREEPQRAIDDDRLFLLSAFAGIPDRRMLPGGRTELLLHSGGVPRDEIAWLFRALRRFESDPKSLEEELVRDAALLESTGAYGVTQALVTGTRERMTLGEMADDLDARMASVRFSTAAARRLSEERIAFARDFARRLRSEVAEFEG